MKTSAQSGRSRQIFSPREQSTYAFTLTDLLVVIAISALLAAVLLPAQAASKLKPQQIECMSNQKQLAVAENMYLNDFGKFLQPSSAGSYLGPNGEWMGALINYFAKATNVLLCPTAPAAVPATEVAADQVVNMGITPTGQPTYTGTANHCYTRPLSTDAISGWPSINSSYTYNGWMYTSTTGTGGGDGTAIETSAGVHDPAWYYGKESAMEQPALTPYFVDGYWVDAWPAEKDRPPKNLYAGIFANGSIHTDEIGRIATQRHGAINPAAALRNYTSSWAIAPPKGAEVIALADGHVESTTLTNLYSYRWHRTWNPGLINLQQQSPF